MSASVSLAALRTELEKERLDAFLLVTQDSHSSEYPAARFKRILAVSGFGGSVGSVIVTRDRAVVLCDPRYWEEAAATVAPGFEVVKEGDLDAMTPAKWLQQHTERSARVGYDPEQFSVAKLDKLRKELVDKHLVAVADNVVDRVWTGRPELSQKGCWVHPAKLAGEKVKDKVDKLRREMDKTKSTATVLSALDQSMWLLNLRGEDSLESPVAYCYTIVTPTMAKIYVQDWKRIPQETIKALDAQSVLVDAYEQFYKDLSRISGMPGARIWLDRHSTNCRVWEAAQPADIEDSVLPIDLWKAVKNEAEQNGMRDCHVRDAVALTRFLAWLEEEAKRRTILETEAADVLLSFRREEAGFVAPSFETILGAGANGAVIHYRPSALRPASVTSDCMVLIDSGGHYVDGTTDVTRTVHTGSPTPHQRRCYTRVLQGHVDLARAVVAPTTRAEQLDILARLPLYSDGLDYRHGTGHGVGAYLNVHESPPSVNSGKGSATYDGPLLPGFIFSDEPGYYESGSFGIRIESLLLTRKANTQHHFHFPHYLSFENLTLVPFCRKLIDRDLLSSDQVTYIDDFHRRCHDTIAPLLRDRDPRALNFLRRSTRPLRMPHPIPHSVNRVIMTACVGLAALYLARTFIFKADQPK